MKFNKINYLLLFIIIVGIVLRFYNIFNLHLVNDELSALNRTRFNNINDLINNGIMPDGHPALIQIFLYFYTKLFGYSDFIIKLPFLIMGVLSIFLSYKISKRFFNETSGLITASYIAILQYTVMYSQIARPYSSGLFFILLSVYFLQDYIFNNTVKKISIIGFIIAGSLSSYNHYFSLLTMLLIGITALFIVKKENIKIYILSNLAILLLFVPHIKISLYQLNIGGLAWLSKPDLIFFEKYFSYINNYCLLLGVLSIIIFIGGIIYNNGFKRIKYSIFSLIIFILPAIIGYIYSIKISPILQFSVLIFSFPFLIFFISSFIKELSFKKNIILVSSIILLGIFSLTVKRKHYTITYKSPFYNIANNLNNDIKKYGNNNISEVFTLNGNFYINKYLNEFNVDTTILKANYQTGKFNLPEFESFLFNSNTNYFAFCSMGGVSDLYLLDIVKQKYPYLIKITDSYFLFSKQQQKTEKTSNVIDTVYHNKINFANNNSWKFDVNKIFTDTISHKKYYYYNTNEWGISLDIKLDSILSHKENVLITKAVVKPCNNTDFILVSEISTKDSLIHWSGSNLSDFSNCFTSNILVYNTKFLQDIDVKENSALKTYIWNNNKQQFKIYSIEIIVLEGYRNNYGRFNKL